jgi:YbgC/YbaW family acyl-CoA thioester hydrolase
MPTPFRTTRRVEFADTDMAGIVHFANFFRYMEAAEVELLRSLDVSVAARPGGQDFSFPRVAASCDYLRPAYFDDVLDVEVTVRRVGQKSVTYGFEFRRGGEVLARGQVSAVCCRTLPGHGIESVAIPEPVRRRLEALG